MQFCRKLALYECEQLAIDRSQFQAGNNIDEISRIDALKQQLKRLDDQITVWLDALSTNDSDDEPGKRVIRVQHGCP